MRLKQHQQQKRTTCKLVKQKTTKKLIKDSNFQASFQNLFSCQGYFSVQINSRTGEKIKTERFSVKLLTADHQRTGWIMSALVSQTVEKDRTLAAFTWTPIFR